MVKKVTYALRENIGGGEPFQKGEVTITLETGSLNAENGTPNADFQNDTKGTLTVEFVCRERFPCSRGEKFNDNIWEGDVFEIMVRTDRENRYLECSINPGNVAYCVVVTNDGRGNFAIEKRLEKDITEHFYKLEKGVARGRIVLKLEDLYALGMPEISDEKSEGSRIFMNVFRQDFDEKGILHLSAAAPTFRETFHVPKAFLAIRVLIEN